MSNVTISNFCSAMGSLYGFSKATLETYTGTYFSEGNNSRGTCPVEQINAGFCPVGNEPLSTQQSIFIIYGIASSAILMMAAGNKLLNACGSWFSSCRKKPAQTQSQFQQSNPTSTTTVVKVEAQAQKAKLQPQKNPNDFVKAVAIAIKAGEKGANARAKLLEIHAKYSAEIQGRKDIKEAFARLSAAQGPKKTETAKKA